MTEEITLPVLNESVSAAQRMMFSACDEHNWYRESVDSEIQQRHAVSAQELYDRQAPADKYRRRQRRAATTDFSANSFVDRETLLALGKDLFELVDVKADGNCLFRVLAQYFYGSQDDHLFVRNAIRHHLHENSNNIEYQELAARWYEDYRAETIGGLIDPRDNNHSHLSLIQENFAKEAYELFNAPPEMILPEDFRILHEGAKLVSVWCRCLDNKNWHPDEDRVMKSKTGPKFTYWGRIHELQVLAKMIPHLSFSIHRGACCPPVPHSRDVWKRNFYYTKIVLMVPNLLEPRPHHLCIAHVEGNHFNGMIPMNSRSEGSFGADEIGDASQVVPVFTTVRQLPVPSHFTADVHVHGRDDLSISADGNVPRVNVNIITADSQPNRTITADNQPDGGNPITREEAVTPVVRRNSTVRPYYQERLDLLFDLQLESVRLRYQFVTPHSDAIRVECRCKHAGCKWKVVYKRGADPSGQLGRGFLIDSEKSDTDHDCPEIVHICTPLSTESLYKVLRSENVSSDSSVKELKDFFDAIRPNCDVGVLSAHKLRALQSNMLKDAYGPQELNFQSLPSLQQDLRAAGHYCNLQTRQIGDETNCVYGFMWVAPWVKDFILHAVPVLVMDACHYKMAPGGVIYSIQQDLATSAWMPLAIAYFASSENSESWGVFLEYFSEIVYGYDTNDAPYQTRGQSISSMSDRETGIEQAVKKYTGFNVRKCSRHYGANALKAVRRWLMMIFIEC
jgi:hypothetical protein